VPANPMRCRGCPGVAADFGDRSCALSLSALADLSIADGDRSRLSQLPMGHPPAGNGVSGDFLRAVDVAASETAHESIAHRAVPAALVALPVDIRIWLR